MTPQQAKQWRVAKRILGELIELDEAEQEARIAALDLEPDLREKLDRLLAADRTPNESFELETDWIIRPADTEISLQGRRIGAWILDDPIGEGGMSTVYRCRRDTEEYQQIGALKLLRIGMLTREGKLRFEREKRILADLRHTHIAGLLDAGTAEDGTPYIVLEFVDGASIDQYVSAQVLGPRDIVRLLLKVCQAVAFAQQNLIVHRDVKPSNILVDAQGEPRLLDFGIARLIADEDATATTTRAYTPGYAAPEQLAGQPITTATDVFGLGATLFKLLTGRPIYDQPAGRELRSVRFPSGMDRDLQNIVRMAVHEEPQRRYRDAAALADDLSRWLSSRPVQATGRSVGYALRKFAGRHRFGVTATVLLLFTGAAGVTATLWQSRIARQQAEVALRESRQAEAVRDFLIELFEATAGGRVQDQLPTTAELLERGARQAREAYDDRPALKVEMLKVVGSIYGTQGRYADAESLLDQALAVYRALPERVPIKEAEILIWRARSLARSDRDAEAVPLAREAFDLMDPAQPEQLVMREDAADVLMGALIDVSDFDQAAGVARQVYDEVRRYSASDEFLKARSAHTLATVLSHQGETDSAIELMQEAWKAVQRTDRRMELKSSIANGLAVALSRAERHEQALQMAREALSLAKSSYAPSHPRIGRALNNLSSMLADTGRIQEAIETSDQALSMLRSSLGEDHLSVAAAQNNLGKLYADLSQHENALDAYADAARIVEEKLGADDWRRAVLLTNQADSLIELKRFDEARRLLDQAQQAATAAQKDQELAATFSMRAKLNMAAAQPAAAAANAEKALAMSRQLYPDGAGITAQNLARRALLAGQAGEPAAASSWLAQTQSELELLKGDFDRAARDAIRLRTDYLIGSGQAAEAEQRLLSDLSTLRNALGENHPTAAQLQQWIAEARSSSSPE